MKKINLFLSILLCAGVLSAQEFKVEKVSGDVSILRGTSEEFASVRKGDVLLGSDLLITELNSYVQLEQNNSRFILNSNSALNLMNIKKISINDLILALTMEEIRNIPKGTPDNTKNTAVYGTQERDDESVIIAENI